MLVCLNGLMQTQVEELAENRVRLTVEVPGHDVHHAVEHAATDLGGSLKIPGFRKGKVPMPVLVSRLGKERIYAEAVDSHISGWFWNAATSSRVRPTTQPQYDFELPSSDKGDWSFKAEFDVIPKPELPEWKTVEVGAADPEVPADLVDHELEVLRSSVAELVPIEGRPAQAGDTVLIDLISPGGESQRDYVVELGAGRLVEEIELALVGMEAGEKKQVTFELVDDTTREVEAELKEIKEKILPPLDDELAKAASEFSTLAELRADLEGRLREQSEAESEVAFRTAVVDKLVETTGIRADGPLVESRARELLNGLVRSVENRGIPFDTYLQLTGGSPDELIARIRAEAAHSVAREVVLESVADKLDVKVDDARIEELVREQAAEVDEDPEAALEQVRAGGAWEQLREDIRLRDALDQVVSKVTRIPLELAEARDKLWTPDKEKPGTETKLWTPGSKEPA